MGKIKETESMFDRRVTKFLKTEKEVESLMIHYREHKEPYQVIATNMGWAGYAMKSLVDYTYYNQSPMNAVKRGERCQRLN